MISQIVMIIALVSIWLSLAWGLVILFSIRIPFRITLK